MSLDTFHKLPPAEQERFLNSPALKPPGDIVSNLDNPENANAAAHAVLAICLVLSSSMLITRAYSRWIQLRKVEVSDCKPCLFHLHAEHSR